MRLIIYVKIPTHVEPIPLDVIDDRPSQAVLDDILVIAKLSAKNSTTRSYYLSRNGIKLDSNLTLSQNGVKNGILLDLTKINEQDISAKKNEYKEILFEKAPSKVANDTKSTKKAQKENGQQAVPGKKIDFD